MIRFRRLPALLLALLVAALVGCASTAPALTATTTTGS
jgi:type IV pilus biogenesis protein CpaD/CtpE